ncbi:hypothetical protein HDU99_009987 [Rhizoclosmatium hyalinum]|nr:hypothetical protein HDU99_009987 [Rhizoclosmatium hyalinum]
MEAQFLNFDFTKPEMKKLEKEQIMRSVAKLVPADEHDVSGDGGESPTSGETEKTAGQDGEGEKPIAHDLPPIMVTEASVIDTPNPDQ